MNNSFHLEFLLMVLICFWPITLALFAGAICAEFYLVNKLEKRGVNGRPLLVVAYLQMGLPFLPFVLYSAMPGSDYTGEPFGMNEKASLAWFITFSLIFLSYIITAILAIIGLRKSKRKETEQATPTLPRVPLGG